MFEIEDVAPHGMGSNRMTRIAIVMILIYGLFILFWILFFLELFGVIDLV